MADDYEYDVFLSYRRGPVVKDWVHRHFYPLLSQWLPEHHSSSTRIFIDEGIDTGSSWPDALQGALATSRCLVAVWSPSYFRSPWCLAELNTMLDRERQLGFRGPGNPRGLIYPVVIADGDHFPPYAKEIKRTDFREFNSPHPVFSSLPDYVRFDKAIQSMSQELSGMISRAPKWQRDWPVLTPPAPPEPPPELPRL